MMFADSPEEELERINTEVRCPQCSEGYIKFYSEFTNLCQVNKKGERVLTITEHQRFSAECDDCGYFKNTKTITEAVKACAR